MAHSIMADLDGAEARYSHALAIQERVGDVEGAGVSLGGLAGPAAARDDLPEGLDLYQRSLAPFATIGDRAEEAPILSEMAWTHLRAGARANSRRPFFAPYPIGTCASATAGSIIALSDTPIP